MNILFIHPTALGQFEALAPYLAKDPQHRVVFLCSNIFNNIPSGIKIKKYRADKDGLIPLNACMKEAAAVYMAIKELESEDSFRPDLVVGHSGWGSMMYIRAACPSARVVNYLEWYFCVPPGVEGAWFLGRTPEEISITLTQKNAPLLFQMENCDAMFTPSEWQKSLFPAAYKPGIQVIHDGVDDEFFSPLNKDGKALEKIIPELCGQKEIVTFVSRGLEPTRCFPQFMDAVRLLLARRPHCHVVIAGNEKTYYGTKPKGRTWKQAETEKGGFDTERVHFTGWLSKNEFRALLWASTVHVYLTVPFVLSWSMLQAMSAGCCVVSSAVPPVEEAVEDGINGLLVDAGSPERIAERIEEALSDASLRERLGLSARETVMDRYRLEICLQKQSRLLFEIKEKS